MLKLSKIVSYITLIFIALNTQIASASDADRAFLGLTGSAYTIGGSLTGLNPGDQIVLYNNNTDALFMTFNGMFQFAMRVAAGALYNVTVASQPAGQICMVLNGQGTATENVNNVGVVCQKIHNEFTVGGTVQGLFPEGSGLMLQINGSDHLTIKRDGPFMFPSRLASRSDYSVMVVQQPPGQICSVSNGQGTVDRDVTNVGVYCH